MSRDLPARPNLDHLKKQAKELLQALKEQDPDAQLADAQHALAREYGFGSWPRLKAHIESDTAAANPFVGKWTADLSRSKLHPLNRLQAATVGFDIEGDDVTIDFVMVDESGRTDRGVVHCRWQRASVPAARRLQHVRPVARFAQPGGCRLEER